jgi:hypothetical protein
MFISTVHKTHIDGLLITVRIRTDESHEEVKKVSISVAYSEQVMLVALLHFFFIIYHRPE